MPAYLGLRNEYRKFYVVFAQSHHNRVWSAFCGPAFRHCWVFWASHIGPPGLLTPKATIKMESLSAMLDIDVWYEDPNEIAHQFLPGATDILTLTLPFKSAMCYTPRGMITCVSVVKAVMNLKAWWILTPQQLYIYLAGKGAKSLKKQEVSYRY